MMNTKNFTTVTLLSIAMLVTALSSQSALANSHGHQDDHHQRMMDDHHDSMMDDHHDRMMDDHHESMMDDHHNSMMEEKTGHADAHKDTMEHSSNSHGSAMSGSALKSVQGRGVINQVMPDARMITITHEPMEALNWPKMKMHFKVDQKVDLSAIESGQRVEFMLQVREGNNYLVEELKPE